MAHQHAHAHIVRRQRFQEDPDEDSDDSRSSMPSNDDSTRLYTLIPPVVRSRPPPSLSSATTKTKENEDERPTRAPTSTKHGVSTSRARKPSSTTYERISTTSTDSDAEETEPTSLKQASATDSIMVATQVPIPSAASTATAGIASVTAAVSATASAAADAAEEGMSGGAKAGLALGLLVAFCAILTGILLLYRRRKKQMAAAQAGNEKIDLNKAVPPPPQIHVASAPSIRTNRTASTAPRLSLRPVTQFDPTFNDQSKSGGNLNIAAAGGVTAQAHHRGPSDERPTSSWERPGASNAPSANPFNDPESRSGPPSANPFGNSAAVDASHTSIPDSPPNQSPLQSTLQSTQSSKDFANPGLAIATAELSAGPASSPPNELPVPPPKPGNGSTAPPNPAWTEDLPASPGPAPTGALPVAGVMAGGRPQSPGPGPDNVHRVQLDFTPSMQDELDLRAGQLVRMLHEYDDGWALCIRLDRSQQGVVPRTCLSKYPVKPRTGPPRQGPPPGMRGPPMRSPMGPGGVPQPRPLSPGSGRNSPHPPSGRNSPGPRQMQMQNQMPAQHFAQQGPRGRSNSNSPNPQFSQPRQRSNSNGPMAPPPQMDGRPRSNSASEVGARRGPAPGMSPMNPNAGNPNSPPVVNRKPVPGMAI